MQTSIGLRDTGISSKAVRVPQLSAEYGPSFRQYNRKMHSTMHGILKPVSPWHCGFNPNIGAVRGVLPCKAAPFSRYKPVANPRVNPMNGYQVPIGNFTGQKVGVMTQNPVMRPQTSFPAGTR